MSDRYPHLKDTQYPNLANSNVWQYEQNFDFEQFNDIQMHIKVCNVPWDIGEVHVGLKSIPMGNVIGWESKEERDAYLDGLQGIEWDTAYRAYHDGDTIKLPIPFEYLSFYNYVVVDYSKPPVANTDGSGITRFLYFIRDLKQLSINNTQATIWRDSWSMFINDISISHMVLERGHYAMSEAATVEQYLQKPKDNTDYLLTPDVSFGSPSKVSEAGKYIINDSAVFYVIASTAHVQSDNWGTYQTDGWRIPAVPLSNTEQTSPAYSIIAIEGASVATFWENVRTQCPQFMESVKCIYLMPMNMVESIEHFQFCGVTCFKLRALNPVVEVANITKDLFGYGKYENITKLYTAPYCHLEFTDGEGSTVKVNIEDTTSSVLQLANYVSIAYPYAGVKSYLKGIGDEIDHTVKYCNLSERNFAYSGAWWKYVWSYDIPTFAIFIGGKTRSEYNGWYTREGNKDATELAASNAQTISKQNAKVSRQMATNNAQGAKDATSTQNSANTAIKNASNTLVENNANKDIAVATGTNSNNNSTTRKLANNEAQATVQSASIASGANVTVAGTSALASVATTGLQGIAGVQTGALNGFASGGALGAAAGGLAGMQNAVTGIACNGIDAFTSITNASTQAGAAMASANVAANLSTTNANFVIENNNDNTSVATLATGDKRDYTTAYNTTVTSNSNAAASAITAINADVGLNNAKRQYIAVMSGTADSLGSGYADSYTVDKGSAELAYNTSVKSMDMMNKASEREQWLQAPVEQGSFINGEYDVIKPAGVWCNVVTQPFDAIAQAGQQMLRYGYTYDGTVDFYSFNVMPKFAYWKVSDIWCNASTIPDAWVDDIRNLLLHGVTVWRKPEYINTTSIYDN